MPPLFFFFFWKGNTYGRKNWVGHGFTQFSKKNNEIKWPKNELKYATQAIYQ